MQANPFNPVFFTLLLTGVGLLLGAVVQAKFPPKHMNSFYGYRTPRAIRTQAAWEYAQAVAAKHLKFAGLAAMVLAPAGFLFSTLNEVFQFGLAVLFTVIITGLPIILTETALKEKFGL